MPTLNSFSDSVFFDNENMKTEAKIECAVKIGKSFEVGNFRGVLKIDEGEEEILTMSGRKGNN